MISTGKRFLLAFLVLIANTSHAELSHLEFKDIDELIDYPGASPVYGYSALKTNLENRRFFGNYGPKSQEFGCLESSSQIHDLLVNNDDCPLDFISEWIQRLFPSQDGVNFVANQIGTDPVSHLTPLVIGKVLEEIAHFPESDWVVEQRTETFKNRMSDLFFQEMNPKKYNETKLANLRQALAAEDRNERNGSIDLRSRLERQIHAVQENLSRIESQIHNSETLGSNRAIDGIGKKKEYDQLAHILVNALIESKREPSHYPKYLTEHALLAFFIKKSNHKADILHLLQGMPTLLKEQTFLNNPARIHSFLKSTWNKTEYTPEQYLANPSATAADFAHHPERLLFAMMEEKLGSKPIPPLISYGSAMHDSMRGGTYTDCGETSLRNFFNILVYDQNIGKFDLEIFTQIEKARGMHFYPPLKEFYEVYSDPSSAASQAARDFWSQNVMSGHEEVDYLRPKRATHRVCEINAGIDNMMTLINRLIVGLPLGLSGAGQSRSQKLDTLCDVLSRNGKTLRWKVEGTTDQVTAIEKLNYKNIGINLEFRINGNPSFVWDFSRGHFAIRDITKAQESWKDHLLEEIVEQIGPTSESLLIWFLNENTFDFLLTDNLSVAREDMIYSLPLSHKDGKLFAFKEILSGSNERMQKWKHLAERIRRKLPEREDLPTEQEIHSALAAAGYPYPEKSMEVKGDPNSLHALGKSHAIYTRIRSEELQSKFGEEVARKMGISWSREMFSHTIIIGEPLLNQEGNELRTTFKRAKLACLSLNGEAYTQGYEKVKGEFEERERNLDRIRKSDKTDEVKTQELHQVHQENPISGCYLMSREEWEILESDFGYRRDAQSRYVPQILPKLKGRLSWTSSGHPEYSAEAFFFSDDGFVDSGWSGIGGKIRCACGGSK